MKWNHLWNQNLCQNTRIKNGSQIWHFFGGFACSFKWVKHASSRWKPTSQCYVSNQNTVSNETLYGKIKLWQIILCILIHWLYCPVNSKKCAALLSDLIQEFKNRFQDFQRSHKFFGIFVTHIHLTQIKQIKKLVWQLFIHSTVWKLINMKTQLVMKGGSWKGGSWKSPTPAALFHSALTWNFTSHQSRLGGIAAIQKISQSLACWMHHSCTLFRSGAGVLSETSLCLLHAVIALLSVPCTSPLHFWGVLARYSILTFSHLLAVSV